VSAAACNGPENLFVAGFLGESNIIASSALAQRAMPKDAAQLMVRPESITLAAADASAADAIPGKVLATDYLGTSIRYLVRRPPGASSHALRAASVRAHSRRTRACRCSGRRRMRACSTRKAARCGTDAARLGSFCQTSLQVA